MSGIYLIMDGNPSAETKSQQDRDKLYIPGDLSSYYDLIISLNNSQISQSFITLNLVVVLDNQQFMPHIANQSQSSGFIIYNTKRIWTFLYTLAIQMCIQFSLYVLDFLWISSKAMPVSRLTMLNFFLVWKSV